MSDNTGWPQEMTPAEISGIVVLRPAQGEDR